MKKITPIHILINNTKNAADIRYLCGVEPPEVAVFIHMNRRGTLIVSEMEYNRLRRTVQSGITVIYPEKIGSTWKAGPADWIQTYINPNHLTVHADFPFGLAETLRSKGFQIEIKEKSICPQREIKTTVETSAVQQSQHAAVYAMNAAIEQIASSRIGKNGLLFSGDQILTSERVRSTIGHALLDKECIAQETIVACGSHAMDPHERGSGPLYAGQSIVLDIFPRSVKTGYWGDITRTVCRGKAPFELKKMYKAVQSAQRMALQAVKAGVWTDEVHKAAAFELIRRGYRTETIHGVPQGFIHGTGHGVGLEIHESPRVSSAVHQKLQAGMIITIEPGLYYPDLGGIRIEDTILITETGYKMLAACPKQFELEKD